MTPFRRPFALTRRMILRLSARYGRRGSVVAISGVASPQLGNRRDLYVYLPPSYAVGTRAYPVFYMQDGQNLFDPALSFAGSWHVDEAMDGLRRRSEQAIVVGIANAGADRLAEYSPFVDPQHGGGRGDRYLDFIIETVKPLIDERYRTLQGRAHTGIGGSSMGALISLYALFARPDVFGFAAAMSPSLWFAEGGAFSYIESRPFPGGQIYLDVGELEGARTLIDARMMRDLLQSKGYVPDRDLRYVEDAAGRHEEAAWGRRVRDALPFLLGGRADRRGTGGGGAGR